MGAKTKMRSASLVTVFSILLWPSASFAQGCAENLTEKSPVKDVISCLKEVQGEIAQQSSKPSLNLELSQSDPGKASPIGHGDKNWGASGKCYGGSKTIGFYCQIDSGGGSLQNLGVSGDGTASCLWNSVTGDFQAHIQPLCISLK